MKQILIQITIKEDGIMSNVVHRGYGEKETLSQILETIGALEDVIAIQLQKLKTGFSAKIK